jgi:hypothetical protein
MNYNNIRGFNYQPSYGSSGLELWRRFDADIIRKEIGREEILPEDERRALLAFV